MLVTLFVSSLPCLGHRHCDTRRVMPHEALEQLITPADTYLVATLEVVPFSFRTHRSGDAEKQE